MTPVTAPFKVGEVLLDKYAVERVGRAGGPVVAIAARRVDGDEQVTIKVLGPVLEAQVDLVKRIERDALAAGQITSEYASRVRDVGALPGRGLCVVSERLDGRHLAEVIAGTGAMPVRRAVEFVLEACEALAEAHANGMVHGDVRPENLLLVRRADGAMIIKVLDLGISAAALAGSALAGDVALAAAEGQPGLSLIHI